MSVLFNKNLMERRLDLLHRTSLCATASERNQKRRDATCPITAEATHTGGGGKIFKPGGIKDSKTASTLVSPGRARQN